MPLSSPRRRQRYIFILLRWLATTSAVFIVTLWFSRYVIDEFVPKTYEATATIQLPLSPADLGSKPVAKAVMGEIEAPDTLRPVIYNLELEKTWATASDDASQAVLSDDDALERLGSMLKLTVVPRSPDIAITVRSRDPKESADIANAIANQYRARMALVVANPNLRGELGQAEENFQATSGKQAIQVVSPAVVPTEQVRPNPRLCYFLTLGVAVAAAILVGCFIEVVLLFIRASEGEHS